MKAWCGWLGRWCVR